MRQIAQCRHNRDRRAETCEPRNRRKFCGINHGGKGGARRRRHKATVFIYAYRRPKAAARVTCIGLQSLNPKEESRENAGARRSEYRPAACHAGCRPQSAIADLRP
ncbi:hypothetical protein GFL39_27330 [Rhizobium leguminosarum bv. viciae]|nr:hypothetical protein [Rhizobium leguminosarum bv. viciae]NKL08560.1 hypothetical protein [Rhizobium leguminosarum bv. viciae]NKL84035.1 hypothetical protein [Rhizobium leguminosarum bv. viciae]NKL90183.1 hypothetical protein [Rhizobium leguminosarum bv. viciae]NKM93790.1 hypothetical protein [Rhizobium leguminosarum bv. viciae]